jgi:hypothetical protein
MPTFCRHNHLIQNCTICAREQAIEARPIVSSSAPRSTLPRPSTPRSGTRRATAARGPATPGGLRVRRLERGAEDGYSSPLVPGLRSSADAARLADELAFAAMRLHILESRPPGAYAEISAADGDIEERTWLAFLVAYLSPLDADDPFTAIEAVRTPWGESGPELGDDVPLGPRTAHAADRGTRTIDAYRAWVARIGSQAAAFTGEEIWTPERRFDRIFERLSLPGMHRDARFDLLTTLGRLGVYELRAGALRYGGENEVTVAAKRAFGIGDVMVLERRTAQLAEAAGIPLEAFDLGLFNWGRGERSGLGVSPDEPADETIVEHTRAALQL